MIQAPAIPLQPKTLNLIVGLIRSYMGLARDQVVAYNQKWKIPASDGLFISVGLLTSVPYAPGLAHEQTADGLKEVVSLSVQETFSINIMSRNQEAVDRRFEVLMAFGSTAGQQLCDQYGLKLGRLPLGLTDISSLESTAMLNRFNCTINVLSSRSQERIVDYFNRYPTPAVFIEP